MGAVVAAAERTWPMAGRAEELGFVRSALRSRGGAVLSGAAGVGRTRLAREAVAATRTPARWVCATATARAVPLGAFTPLLGRPATLRHGFDEVRHDPRLLVVDDAHLLDDVSATLLHQLVLSGTAPVLVTLCSDEPVPDAVRALWKDGQLPRLEVQPLSEPETVALVEAVLGGAVDGECRRRLWTLSRGNALLLRQLVDGARTDQLRLVREVWRWEGGTTVGPGLAEIVDARLGRLGDEERHALDVVALGEPIGVPLLETLVDATALDRVERRGLVDVEVDGMRVEARLAHPLYGEVLRSRISTLRARRLRGRLADAITATGSRRADDTMRRAVLLLDSDLPPDPDLFTRAARQAVLLHDLPLAERLGRAAWEHDPRVVVGLMLADVQSRQGRSAAAEPVLDRVARLAADDGQRAQIAALRVANLFFTRRRPQEALRTLDRACDSLRDPDELRGLRVALVAHLGRLSEAIPAGRRVLATESAGPNARVWAGFGLCHVLGRAGRLTEAAAAAAAAGAAVRSGGSAVAVQLAHAEVTALALAGALDRAAERAEDQRGTDPAGPMACLLAGHVDVACGRVTDGVRNLREARAGVSGRDPGAFTHHAQLLLPHALGMLGEAADARAAQQEAEASRHPGVTLTEPDLLLGRAWVAAAEGVTSEAVVHARHAATTAAGCGQFAVEVLARHTAVCLGDTTAGARLTGLTGLVEGPRVRVAAAHATALAEHDAAGLAAASTAAQAMGALLVAADAAAQASAEYERAGDRRSALSCAARAQYLARLCGGAATPALCALTAVAPLTGRERETVALAAAGLSNQDIAVRLVVSVRTVEGHLYRAFAKLGVAERSELVSG